jgi:hypothetical protein
LYLLAKWRTLFVQEGKAMKHIIHAAVLIVAIALSPARAQVSGSPENNDYLAGADARNSSQNANRPVIGLNRKADFIAVLVSFSSDSRDALVRRDEIHTMLVAALDLATGSGLELVTGTPNLMPVTKANYQAISFQWAGREDTSKADVFIKVPLTTTAVEVDKRIDAFIKALPRKGRGLIEKSLGRQLAIRNPEQYRSAIIALVAEDVQRNAAVFGPDYRGSIDGLDKPVLWTQSNDTEVFLYLPYSYRIIAK